MDKRKIVLFILFLGLYTRFSFAISGTNTRSAYPHEMAAVGFLDGNCSGTLIHGHYFLTAKHCVYSRTQGHSVRFPNSSNPNVKVDVEKLITTKKHSYYIDIKSNKDFALLKLNKAVLKGLKITSLDLWQPLMKLPAQVIIAGHGRSQLDRKQNCVGPMSDVLRLAEVSVKYESEGGWTRANFDNASVCSGDSGGPLLFKVGGVLQVFGVASNGGFNFGTYSILDEENVTWMEESQERLEENISPEVEFIEFGVGETNWVSSNLEDLELRWEIRSKRPNPLCIIDLFATGLLNNEKISGPTEKVNIFSKRLPCAGSDTLDSSIIRENLEHKISFFKGDFSDNLLNFADITDYKTLTWVLSFKENERKIPVRQVNCVYFRKKEDFYPYRRPNFGHHCTHLTPFSMSPK